MFKTHSIRIIPFVAMALFSSTAFAQPAPYGPPPGYAPAPAYPPPAVQQPARPSPSRDGFTLGVALGGGELKIDDEAIEADHSLGLSLRAGFALSQSFLLQGTLDLTRAENNPDGVDKGALQLNLYGVSATAYLWPRLFITGGLGYASLVVDDKDEKKADSMALMLGVGVEIIQTSGFALSLELRGLGAAFDETKVAGGNLLIGLQWF